MHKHFEGGFSGIEIVEIQNNKVVINTLRNGVFTGKNFVVYKNHKFMIGDRFVDYSALREFAEQEGYIDIEK